MTGTWRGGSKAAAKRYMTPTTRWLVVRTGTEVLVFSCEDPDPSLKEVLPEVTAWVVVVADTKDQALTLGIRRLAQD